MPKYGRRKWVRYKRMMQREWRAHNAKHTDEQRIAIECGLDSFWRYRTSETWQALGWWGRWCNAWKAIAWDMRGNSTTTTLAYIFKRAYSDRQIVDAARGGPPLSFADIGKA